MKPGTLIVIGTLALVVGFIPPVSLLVIVSGGCCLYFGWNGLKEEGKEKQDESDK